jgi:hypothetical protein
LRLSRRICLRMSIQTNVYGNRAVHNRDSASGRRCAPLQRDHKAGSLAREHRDHVILLRQSCFRTKWPSAASRASGFPLEADVGGFSHVRDDKKTSMCSAGLPARSLDLSRLDRYSANKILRIVLSLHDRLPGRKGALESTFGNVRFAPHSAAERILRNVSKVPQFRTRRRRYSIVWSAMESVSGDI